MTAMDDGMNLFDFDLDDFLGQSNKKPVKDTVQKEQNSTASSSVPLSSENEAITSYLLVNTLLNLLVAKGIIYPHEINALLAELYVEYRKHKRGGEDGDKD